ncbi:patatin-like phospholipase family protein [Spirillospora sp. CA-142024]|uniref:patatin-like phospholipase family protein n=1 Tax=Spirillospora sp. CA-142024 TaxID=3240036 RepID=UPI003D92E706
MSDNGRALVLGGGGVAGIAWLTGFIAGLAAEGTDVTGADLMVGTSAGSVVAAQIGSGLPIGDLFERQADPALQNRELVPSGGMTIAEFMEVWQRLAEADDDPAAIRRGLGGRAMAADTLSEPERRTVIEGRLPEHEWPSGKLLVTAVNALTGDLRVFDRDSGVPLVDAIAASCALPMIWPPTTIDGVRYVDGGIRSMNNLDLAAGHERVLVISPMDDPGLAADIAVVEGKGGRVEVVRPDDASQTAAGTDPLSPSTRTPSANAGLAQGRAAAERIGAFWG